MKIEEEDEAITEQRQQGTDLRGVVPGEKGIGVTLVKEGSLQEDTIDMEEEIEAMIHILEEEIDAQEGQEKEIEVTQGLEGDHHVIQDVDQDQMRGEEITIEVDGDLLQKIGENNGSLIS